MNKLITLLLAGALLTGCAIAPTSSMTPDSPVTPTLSAPSATAIPTHTATALPSATPQATAEDADALNMQSDSAAIRMRILRSQTRWQTFFADATQIIYPTKGSPNPPLRIHMQVWFNQSGQMRLLSALEGERPEMMSISDGDSVTFANLRTGTSNRARLSSLLPFAQTQPTLDTADARSLKAMGSMMVLGLFPSGTVQPGGVYAPVALEKVAGRDALLVEYTPVKDAVCMGFGCTRTLIWVDALTGICLRAREADDAELVNEVIVNSVQYNAEIPSGMFNPPAGLGADFIPVSGGALDGFKPFENREVNLAFYIPAAWTVLEPDHNAAGIQIIMGPPPISWTSHEPSAVAISIADTTPTVITDELAMLCVERCKETPAIETITLPNGLPVRRATAPQQVLGAPETHSVWYIIEFGPKTLFMSMDSAKADISWERLLSTFGPLDGTKPAGYNLD